MKLNVGSGFLGADSLWKDWKNVDFAYEPDDPKWQKAEYLKFDIREKWQLEDNVADCIFASHVLEHIEYDKLFLFITECHRVMKPEAPIRIICPDPRIFIKAWRQGNTQFIKDSYGMENWDRWGYENNTHIGYSDMFFGEHYAHAICPSIDLVTIFMIRAGFKDIADLTYTCTKFPEFFKNMDNRPMMSWYLEAVK